MKAITPRQLHALLDEPFSEERKPVDVAYELWGLIERDSGRRLRPDTELSEQEVAFRDAVTFHSAGMGNGFEDVLWHANGRSSFVRAFQAADRIGLEDVSEILSAVRVIYERHGIVLPIRLDPEWWVNDKGALPDDIIALREETKALTIKYWNLPLWPEPDCVYIRLLRYLSALDEAAN
jgi:hypothetical protein